MPFKVQIFKSKRAANWIGSPWETVRAYGSQATAERVAERIRTDNADALVRVRDNARTASVVWPL